MAYTTKSWPPTYLPDNTAPAACAVDSACLVVAAVNIPGQNLNNAKAINFAGVYHPGACVPVPTCPTDAQGVAMTPEVFVVPISLTGYNDANQSYAYPINSFTAFVSGTYSTSPANCPGYTGLNYGSSACPGAGSTGVANPSGLYWRVCLQVITTKGDVAATNPNWDQLGYVAAFTRCSISNEPSGSGINIFGTG